MTKDVKLGILATLKAKPGKEDDEIGRAHV